VTVEQNFDI